MSGDDQWRQKGPPNEWLATDRWVAPGGALHGIARLGGQPVRKRRAGQAFWGPFRGDVPGSPAVDTGSL